MNAPGAGWYPNPQNPNEQRYWDGTAWTDHVAPLNVPEPTVILPAPEPPPPSAPAAPTSGPPRWYQRRWVWVVGGVVLLLVIIGSVTPSSDDPADASATVDEPQATATVTAPAPAQPTVTATVTAEPAPTPTEKSQVGNNAPADEESFVLPDETGKNLQAAQDDLQAVSGNPFFFSDSIDATGEGRFQAWDSNWQVCSQKPEPGTRLKVDSDEIVTFYVVRTTESCP